MIERFKKSGVPIVVIDFRVDEIDFDVVNVDNVTGGYLAMKYLYDHGHRDILFSLVLSYLQQRKTGKKVFASSSIKYQRKMK